MQQKKKFDLVLFDSPHQAIAFDQKSKERKLGGRLIPVPRVLSASCGMCYRSHEESREALKAFMEEEEMKYNSIVEDFEF